MGVPLVTLPAETFASRHSLAHLSAGGLTEYVASDLSGYVQLAAELAGDQSRRDASRPARTGCPFPFVRRSPVRPPLRHRYANGVVPVLRRVLGARTTR